ncbi:unnamed protein product [Rhizoctonia solani]|uniref:Laminin domain protein n=1 Tax=Rhizoctonia solani TaxID=456999 RepID=A0A8H3ARJ8_9AGAM|nr:unnamed protein product [Rhizoctonia solani]
MAQKAADIPGTGDRKLLARLYDHLFDAQMAKYRAGCFNAIFPEVYGILFNTTYTPPTLPVYVTVRLEPVTGTPSEEEAIKVQSAVQSYQQFANVPALFDSRVDMELSQHLFDVQMARYTQRARQSPVNGGSGESLIISSARITQQPVAEELGTSTNNSGTGGNFGSHKSALHALGSAVQDAIERSNRLAEQANQLIERSNQIAERANQLVEESTQPVDQSNQPSESFSQLFEYLNGHLEQLNHLAKEGMQPVERLGNVLENINKVLMRIQHAIVRNHKANTISALDCLVNEKGETPATSSTTKHRRFEDVTHDESFAVMIDGALHHSHFSDKWLGEFIRLYGIGDGMFEDASTVQLKAGISIEYARMRLREFLESCLG